jgi:D-alanine--poly(phosphoribitol) ligase subunit 1
MSLSATLKRVAETHARRTALVAQEADYAYADLAAVAPRLADLADGGPRRVAILAERDAAYYGAIFSCALLGWTYVPLNSAWPVERIARILERAAPDVLVVDAGARAKYAPIWADGGLAPVSVAELAREDGGWRLDPVAPALAPQLAHADEGFLYIMFTSGSTGEPKGVPITYANVEAYVEGISAFGPFSAEDVFLQAVELTFDLSVHDMMLCWVNGGKLICVPAGAAPFAPRFIRRYEVTTSLMVPSAAAQSKINGLLARSPMPSLRVSFFCGEALSGPLAKSWSEAAANSVLYNIYGPTEATIAFSAFRFDAAAHGEMPTLPLGFPMGEQVMSLAPDDEVMLGGSQLSPGYLNDPERTAERFPVIEGRRWYLTGDRGGFDAELGYLYRGRTDGQIKLRGYRVELGDIEAQLRASAGTDLVAAIATAEAGPSTYDDVVAFVSGAGQGEAEILARLRELLPPYMLPSRIIDIADMPKNSNGKIDRPTLSRRLRAGEFAAEAAA